MRRRVARSMRKPGQAPRYPNGFTKEQIESCIHRGDAVGKLSTGCSKCAQVIYNCDVHGKCTFKLGKHNQTETPCVRCRDCEPASLVQLKVPNENPEVVTPVDTGPVPVPENPVPVSEDGENGDPASPA